ncbi:E3 ubiquitin-protein ligase CHIP-like [Sycon ciliatum]|uniref:E3 ubiquitin-protein ligase CHIP-like n=1 Tax=Sycon ciliatum TaxID=27933 RepID=UPI0031F70848|eukprot:scpid36758/ scgid16244/ E3 ubiquitin-protein ligase CHIP; Antigen NY-CO-7; CLL-associated antigen KW-8; Carboxy terminus of Hsp70-interacting protein; STIP1 homology and U box-containing protein 1
MSASQLKAQGNKLFSAGQYGQAVECYSKAMLKDPGDSKFYGNRALCYNRMTKYSESLTDCQKAIELNQRYAKAFYFQGEALLGLEKYDEAISSLTKSLQLATEQHLFFGDEISTKIKLAKSLRWQRKEQHREKEEIELQTFLNGLIDEKKKSILDAPLSRPADEFDAEMDCRKRQVADLFAMVDERRSKREVPDNLCCQISYEVMRDPVITPSGVSYDRSSIQEHLERVGHFDPLTRAPLTHNDLIPNLALKEVIEDFLAKNEWADDY